MKIKPSVAFLTFTLATLVLTGCGTTKPGSASFASVLIHQHTAEEIQTVTAQVFREEGYAGGVVAPMQMVFQREGTRGQNLAYEGIAGTHYGAQTLVRVRAGLVDLGGNSFRLQCKAFIVTGAGDQFFEDEKPLAHYKSGPYQRLLNQVQDRLK